MTKTPLQYSLEILWLWPDILNLHGDRGNVMALSRVCEIYGIDANITRVNRLTDDIDPPAADLIIMNPGELASIFPIVKALEKSRASLESFVEEKGVLLTIGTTGAALATKTERADGTTIDGLGLLDMICKERKSIIGDDLIVNAFDKDVYGIQIQMMDTMLGPDQKPFAEVIYGYGNNGKQTEGAMTDNVIFTNMLGPVLVKNPWLTLELIRRALLRKNKNDEKELNDLLKFDPAHFELELRSAEDIKKFNTEKEKPAFDR